MASGVTSDGPAAMRTGRSSPARRPELRPRRADDRHLLRPGACRPLRAWVARSRPFADARAAWSGDRRASYRIALGSSVSADRTRARWQVVEVPSPALTGLRTSSATCGFMHGALRRHGAVASRGELQDLCGVETSVPPRLARGWQHADVHTAALEATRRKAGRRRSWMPRGDARRGARDAARTARIAGFRRERPTVVIIITAGPTPSAAGAGRSRCPSIAGGVVDSCRSRDSRRSGERRRLLDDCSRPRDATPDARGIHRRVMLGDRTRTGFGYCPLGGTASRSRASLQRRGG